MAGSLEAAYNVSHHHALKSIRGFLRSLRATKLILQIFILVAFGLIWQGCGRRMERAGEKIPQIEACSRRIAFASAQIDEQGNYSQRIYTIQDDGADMRRLTPLTDGCPQCPDDYPVWSPAGDKVAFTSLRNEIAKQIYIINTDGTGMTQLTYGSEEHYAPDVSCDGKKIAYTFRNQVWVMDSDGGSQKPVTTGA